MSTYATMEGWVRYPDKESFDKVVDVLTKGGWLDPDGYFLDDDDERVREEAAATQSNSLEITIPWGIYRNMCRVTFFTEGAVGRIVGTCTDGCTVGWVQTEEGSQEWPLAEFTDEPWPDPDADFEGYLEAQSEAEENFFEEHGE